MIPLNLSFNPELANTYGVTKAVLLQYIATSALPVEYKGYWERLFYWMTIQTMKKHLDELQEMGLLVIESGWYKYQLGLSSSSAKQVSLLDMDKIEGKVTKQKSDLTAMNEIIRTATNATNLIPYPRYLKLAKQLIKEGYTPQQIDDYYIQKSGGWWATYKGKQGKHPTEFDIRQTVGNINEAIEWSVL